MKRRLLIGILLVMAGVTASVIWWFTQRHKVPTELVLYGNVDLRQVELPFNNSERIAAVLVEEGDRVQRGEVLARLDTSRLEPQVAQAAALVAVQRQIVARLHHGNRPEEIAQARAQAAAQQQVVTRLRRGNRPEEIAQARANVMAAQADTANTRKQYQRLQGLSRTPVGQLVSQQDVESARATMEVTEAKLLAAQKGFDLAVAGPRQEEVAAAEATLLAAQKALDLTVAGPRQEEIAEAEARLQAAEAQLALLQQALADAQLVAPVDAVVRSRLLEPGEMASPQKPVLSLAITDPKWVRAYVAESDLGYVSPGMTASVGVDSFAERRFEGWIGFLSPVAEFTPKAVQTEELRTSLVYEVRVFVKDPSDVLRLGMPATVYLALPPPSSPPSPLPARERQ